MIDFDVIWQKYSQYSGIEFVCFGFHVDLLVFMLSSLKLHTENNACMFLLLTDCVTRNFRHFR